MKILSIFLLFFTSINADIISSVDLKLAEIDTECSVIEKQVDELYEREELPTQKQVHDLILRMVFLNRDIGEFKCSSDSFYATQSQNKVYNSIQERMLQIVRKLATMQDEILQTKRSKKPRDRRMAFLLPK